MSDVRLKDITRGGRIRVDYQHKMWSIAREAARKTTSSTYGNMVTSEETTTHYFLDGDVSDTRGFFDASSGMRISGRLVRAYVVYKLGLAARELLKDPGLPGLEELERRVLLDKEEAASSTEKE